MTNSEPWTIGRLLTWTTDFLRDKGADSPRLDAEVLLAHARDCQRIELYTSFEEEPAEEIRTAFRELVQRRAAGTPVAYLVGHREFFSLSFQVTPDVLIPRPETELLVVRALDLSKSLAVSQIADIGTGSGILAICCAKHIPESRITAIDICPNALKVAAINAEKHSVADSIEFLQSDLLASCPAEARFDLIVSNPPYISTAELAELDGDVCNHEPHLALVGGAEGTEVIERLIPQAVEQLNPGGWLLVEVSPHNAERVAGLISAAEGMTSHDTINDLANLPRVVQARRNDE
jgi:release factor glutamine methyltransferase